MFTHTVVRDRCVDVIEFQSGLQGIMTHLLHWPLPNLSRGPISKAGQLVKEGKLVSFSVGDQRGSVLSLACPSQHIEPAMSNTWLQREYYASDVTCKLGSGLLVTPLVHLINIT